MIAAATAGQVTFAFVLLVVIAGSAVYFFGRFFDELAQHARDARATVGVGGESVSPSSSVSRELTTDAGGSCCTCNPRWAHVSDADCPLHGVAALCRTIRGVYDQETDQVTA